MSERGRAEALAAAHCIAGTGLEIDAALISPALRTRQTIELIAGTLQIGRLTYESALYLGGADLLLQSVLRCEERFSTVLVVGHNPGISELAQHLSVHDRPLSLRTAGLCRIELPQHCWSELDVASATAVAVLR